MHAALLYSAARAATPKYPTLQGAADGDDEPDGHQ